MVIRRAKIALALFIMFLAALVILADSGRAYQFFAMVEVVPGGDKFGHFLLFGMLTFLVILVGQGRTTRLAGFTIPRGSLIVMALVTLEEFSQLFFRSRTFDLLDLASDAVGIWVFGRIALAYLEYKRGQLQPAVALQTTQEAKPLLRK